LSVMQVGVNLVHTVIVRWHSPRWSRGDAKHQIGTDLAAIMTSSVALCGVDNDIERGNE